MDRLLEREDALGVLAGALEAARSGSGAMVLVSGEAGIGKTSLLRAVRDTGGLPFYLGKCEPLSIPEPLGPVRELAEAAGAGERPELESGERRALARVLVTALTAHGAAMAAVEDAHWADPATLDVLRILARRVEEVPLALVLTLRNDELAANPPLARLVGDLATESRVSRIELAPLSMEAVRMLAGADGADAREVARVTGGNPFLVVEMLAAPDRLPASVRDATMARVSRLSSDARGLVDLAAVVGERVPAALLDVLAPEQASAVEEALARGVLTDDGATLGFRHELIRRSIESALSTPRRTALHASVANALAAREEADHARIAHHADAAGLGELAAQHAALAAVAAERVGALYEAGRQFERALRLGNPDEAQRIDLLIRYARAINFSGRALDEARSAAQEAVGLADAAGDRRAGGRARAVLSATLWSLDRLTESRTAAAAAVTLLTGSGALEELARAHAALLRIESIAFDPAAAIVRGQEALAAAAEASLDEARIDMLISLGLAHGHRGSGEARPLLEQARREASIAGTAIQVIRAHVNSVSVASDARNGAWADRVANEAFARFDEFETTIPRQYLTVVHARTLLDRGRYDEALARLVEGRRDWHGGVVLADAIESLVQARRGQGDPRARLLAALAEIEGLPPGWRHMFLHAALAEVAWIAGHLEEVREHARVGLAAPYARQLVRPAADALLWAARAGQRIEPDPLAVPLPVPVARELAGDWRTAIDAWRALEAPYEAALAALPADDRTAREAMMSLQRLGAAATARAFAREREARGAASLRGPRRSTLSNAAGLTRREQDVLRVLAGGATNPQIASMLHLSERTVAHHVSAILSKLGASTRTAAVENARAAGLLVAQDGPAQGPT
ncbi:MAG: ATP-binding protein [Solirubrobacteraceae bacterium]